MVDSEGPFLPRKRVGSAIKALRERAGVTIEQAADKLEMATTTIWRIEAGRTKRMRSVDIIAMGKLYKAGDEIVEELLDWAREARKRPWWQEFGDVMAGEALSEMFIGLEADAKTLSEYQNEFIPGLLQTDEYAESVVESVKLSSDRDYLDRMIDFRHHRKRKLSTDCQTIYILNEAVLRRVVGSPSIMKAQLQTLAEFDKVNVSLRVLPFSAGAHPGMSGNFTIFRFENEEDPDIVSCELTGGFLFFEDEETVEGYMERYDKIKELALNEEESRTIIQQTIQSL